MAGTIAPFATDETAIVSLDVASAFSDPDGNTLTYTATGLPSGLSISLNGVISGTAPEVTADESFTVRVIATDPGGLSASSDFQLSVNDTTTSLGQTPFPGEAPVLVGDGALTVDATNFDAGGQGVSWNDNPGLDGGTQSRGDTDVELVGSAQDIGYVLGGEWVEYTIDVAQAGFYDLNLLAKTPIAGNTIAVSLEDGTALATYALADANGSTDNGFGGTAFAATGDQQISLGAGLQTLRFTFDGAPATNGYLLDFRSFTLDAADIATPPPAGPVTGQSGTATFSQASSTSWTSVAFDTAMVNPVVVAGPASTNDAEPGTVRIQNVTSTGFEIQFDEWDYLDGVHATELVSWLAIEAGVHDLGGGLVIEAGSGIGSSSVSTVGLTPGAFASAPVVLAQVTGFFNGPESLAPRISNVDEDSFDFLVHEQEGTSRLHGDEGFGWIAVSPGNFGALSAGITPNAVTHLLYDIDFGEAPREGGFLAAMQSLDGPDTAAVRLADLSSTGASVFIEEEQAGNPEIVHTTEILGWIALDQGPLIA